jgi:hypothetical protein
MAFFIARISGGALCLVFTLLAFVLQRLIGKSKLSALTVRIISAIGIAGGLYIITAAVRNLLRYPAGISSVITVWAPLLLFALGLALHFALVLWDAPSPNSGRMPVFNLTAALPASLQLAFALFNLIRNWNNLTRGMKEFLYIQLLALAFIAVNTILFWISYRKARALSRIRSRLGAEPEHYARLGIKKGDVEPWEDGTRTKSGVRGTYEWWYFDFQMDDGTTLVIVFYTKHMMSPGAPPAPHVTISLVSADGGTYAGELEVKGTAFSASAEGCDVRIGPCYCVGNLREYDIYFKNDRAEARAHLTSNVPPWRPETGHIFFGDKDERYFAWLPSVPEGDAEAVITLDGKTTRHTGTGYHDHNWGNANMRLLMNRWYWGRAKIGDYRVITSYIYGEKKYGYNEFPIFMLAGKGRIIADNAANLTFSASGEFVEEATGKPAHNRLVYDYEDGGKRFRVIYSRKRSIVNYKMIDELRGPIKFLARLAGFDGAYHRFTGDAAIERLEGGKAVEKTAVPAIWELMYFGRVPK